MRNILNCKLFLHYCPCPTIHDADAVYPVLFLYKQKFESHEQNFNMVPSICLYSCLHSSSNFPVFSRGHATLHLAMLVGRSVGPLVRHIFEFERFSHYCSCPTVRDWIAVYPVLLNTKNENFWNKFCNVTGCWWYTILIYLSVSCSQCIIFY